MKLGNFPERDFDSDVLAVVSEVVDRSDKTTLVYIEGGHFDPRFTEDEDIEFSLESQRAALELTTRLIKTFGNKVRIVLGVLVDNLGQQCGRDACAVGPTNNDVLKEIKDLPPQLQNVLNDYETYGNLVKPEKFVITTERAAKNRAVKNLRGRVNGAVDPQPPLVISRNGDGSKIFFEDKSTGQILLATFHGDVWSVQCPAIMGTHYNDSFNTMSTRLPDSPSIVIDFSEAADREKVTGGSRVALGLFMPRGVDTPRHIINITSIDPGVTSNFVDHFSNQI